jgi:hypothetical protein
MTSKVITVQLLDKMPEDGGVNVMTPAENVKITEALSKLPNRIHRNYWILVLSADRQIETAAEFINRMKAEVKRFNTVQKNDGIAQSLEKPRANYFA